MKKIHNQTKPQRSFRRYVKKLFSNFIKHQKRNCPAEQEKIIEMLQDIQESIEIIARQIARWIRPGE